MTVDPLTQASLHKAEILKRIEHLSSERDAVEAALARARADLAYMSGYIAALEKISAQEAVDAENDKGTRAESRKKKRVRNPPREEVVEKSLALIAKAKRPLSRQELYDQLTEDGVVINGANPLMVFSTMLWRTPDRIVRLRPFGYWAADQPYEPANYAPTVDQPEQGSFI